MKKIKAIIPLMMALVICFSACTSGGSASKSAAETKPLTELMAAVIKGTEEEVSTADIEITEENFKSFLFIEPVDGAEALANEAQINAIAHSVVLLRVPEGTDAAKTAEEIKAAANPRKWICVEAEKTEVVRHGSLILLVMSSSDVTDKIVQNFNALF